MARSAFHIPLFPLGVFLLPGERTGLHIFEPRYRQLVGELEDAIREGRDQDNRFGIPFHHEDVTASTGCLARLVEVKKVHRVVARTSWWSALGILRPVGSSPSPAPNSIQLDR